MNGKRSTLTARVLITLVIALAAVATGFALKATVAKSGASTSDSQRQNRTRYRFDKYTRKVKLDKSGTPPSIAMRLNGLQAADFVNIRPTDEPKIEVTAGLTVEDSDTGSNPDRKLPASALEVTASEINFIRPSTTEGTVVLDVQVPLNAQMQASVDGKAILNTTLQKPVSISRQSVAEGATSISNALVQALIPAEYRGKTPDGKEMRLDNSNRYYVPFNKLRLLNRVDIGDVAPRDRAALEIDENGRVTKVTLFTNDPAPGLEDALKQWQFAPYIVDGNPVPVVTLIALKIQ